MPRARAFRIYGVIELELKVTWLNFSLPASTAKLSPLISPACNVRSQHGNHTPRIDWYMLRGTYDSFVCHPRRWPQELLAPIGRAGLNQQRDTAVSRNQNFTRLLEPCRMSMSPGRRTPMCSSSGGATHCWTCTWGEMGRFRK